MKSGIKKHFIPPVQISRHIIRIKYVFFYEVLGSIFINYETITIIVIATLLIEILENTVGL